MAQEAEMRITGDASVAEALRKLGAFDDLLRACESARDFVSNCFSSDYPLVAQIDSAIAKATEPTP
jgi:hypothetical protein